MENLFKDRFALSSISLQELESIKTSNKGIEIKQSAQKLLRLLDQNYGKYDVHVFKNSMLKPIEEKDLFINNDMKILACALDYDSSMHPDETIFVTNDLALKNIANLFFGEDSIISVKSYVDTYCGYTEEIMNDEEMAFFYSNLSGNIYNLHTNEYLIIRDRNGQPVDKLCWTGSEHRQIGYYNFDSTWLGNIKPIKGDIYQAIAVDSLVKNKITMLRGPAGTGKDTLGLGYLLSLLDKNKIDKIIIFCNTVATKDSARLGYLPGDRNQKLMDSQIGNFLSSKLGGRIAVEQMIDNEKLILLPFSDIRGYDTTGMRAGVYITEAQNLNIPLIKLALQRIGNDSICVINGDDETQVDDIAFAGINNGMKRVSQVFRGSNIYGEVKLKTIYRSEIAKIAEGL